MMTLIIAAAAAAQPVPAPAMQMGGHPAEQAKEKCCCKDMAKKGEDHGAAHKQHSGS